jgi:hypothetical protein
MRRRINKRVGQGMGLSAGAGIQTVLFVFEVLVVTPVVPGVTVVVLCSEEAEEEQEEEGEEEALGLAFLYKSCCWPAGFRLPGLLLLWLLLWLVIELA